MGLDEQNQLSQDALQKLRQGASHSSAAQKIAQRDYADGKTLASSSSDGVIKIWNIHTSKLLQTLSGRSPIAFSPDGKILVSGAKGGSIKIWKMQNVDEFPLNPLLSGEWWGVLGVC